MPPEYLGDLKGMFNSLASLVPECKYPPPEVLPCANVGDKYTTICKKPGKLACSVCRLVSYCSKDCQRIHWISHKQDCKHPIRSKNWKPGWTVEGRVPRFLSEPSIPPMQEIWTLFQDMRLSAGLSLWGNTPAMDIVNLPNNEKKTKTDLSLAFAASGDIRNVIATVNALGSDHSGSLNILLNDRDRFVTSRNIALLMILGTIPDEVIAADMALHFWYSAFMPFEYRFRIQVMVMSTVMKNGKPSNPIVSPLGPHSMLTSHISSDVQQLLFENVGDAMSFDEAQEEYMRVRNVPSRADYRDRMYLGLKPSHRLAFLKYWRFGIILPFGALDAHCNVPNPSLFADGVWAQTDYADPLEGWDLNEVVRAGKAHGAQPEDVYGCLFFFLTDQLRAFSRHIRRHRISFHVFNSDACALARGIAQGEYAKYGISSNFRFDRIDVSNIMDSNYVGVRGVMDTWGPLLAKTDHAALTGYFMNWSKGVGKSTITSGSEKLAWDLMMKSGRIRSDIALDLALDLAMQNINAFYDTSKAFSKYWKDQGAAQGELRLRSVHKILPYRLGSDINSRPGALPNFADDDTWYHHAYLTNSTWMERFVELCHK